MATTVTHIVDPDNGVGTDYTSLQSWEAGEQGDLTGVRDEIAIAKCRCTGGTADTTAPINIDGWTTDSTRYIKIWTDPAESYRHEGSYPTEGNKYRLYVNGGAGVSVYIYENYTKIEGIAIKIHTYATTCFGSTSQYLQLASCVMSADSARTNSGGVALNGLGCVIVNNYIENLNYAIKQNNTVDATYVYNNTIRNCTVGITGHWSNACRAKNNLVDSSTTAYDGGFHADSTNNAGDDDTAPGSNAIDNITVSFTGANNCILAATGNDEVIGDAANLYNDAAYAFQTDILGTDRGGSGASWDIGAYEYVAAGGAAYPFYVKRRLNVLLRMCVSMFSSLFGRLFQ